MSNEKFLDETAQQNQETQAKKGGRTITLDPIRTKVIDVPWREVESTIPCGFQIPWLEGECNGAQFQLDCGAGVGSQWMTFRYKGRGYCISVASIVEKLIAFSEETEEEA